MKIILPIIFSFSIFASSSQINQRDFDLMLAESNLLIFYFEYAKFESLESTLSLSKDELQRRLGKILTDPSISFNSYNSKSYIVASFKETTLENTLELTIIANEVFEKKEDETFSRANYFFVLKTDIEVEDKEQNIILSNTKLITEEEEVHEWWVTECKDYLTETTKIKQRFGFLMPPPPPQPLNLK